MTTQLILRAPTAKTIKKTQFSILIFVNNASYTTELNFFSAMFK